MSRNGSPRPDRLQAPGPAVRTQVPLAGYTTLGVGGPADRLIDAGTDDEIIGVIRDVDQAGQPLLVLGGGSNLVVSDAGFAGTVIRIASSGIRVAPESGAGTVLVTAAAGQDWDALVERCVADGLSGIECLSGIPGLTGATPIQNVGAYGQEVAQTLVSVRAFDRLRSEVTELPAAGCGFGYRTSAFKRDGGWPLPAAAPTAAPPGTVSARPGAAPPGTAPGVAGAPADVASVGPGAARPGMTPGRVSPLPGTAPALPGSAAAPGIAAAPGAAAPGIAAGPTGRFVILGVTFRLERSPLSAPLRYSELAARLAVPSDSRVPLRDARDAVLALRRGKGMVLDAGDPDTRSAGSFFTNPVLGSAQFAELERLAAARSGQPVTVPHFAAEDGLVKVPAAWLIEQAGFGKGYQGSPAARISSKHTLALTNQGGATATDLVALARQIRDGVRSAFGVDLASEPVLVGLSL